MPSQTFPEGRTRTARCRADGPSLDDIAFAVTPLTEADWKEISEQQAKRFSGFFVSNLMGEALAWRGLRHLAALSLFELDPAIDRIEVMPEHVTLSVGGKVRRYTPHFRLRSGLQVTVADVLRKGQENSPTRAAVTTHLEQIYAARGVRYVTLPEKLVTAEPRLGNARAVLECRGHRPAPETEMAVVETLSEPGRHTVGTLAERLDGGTDVKNCVFALATRRTVRLNLRASRHEDMEVRLLTWQGFH